MKPGVWLQVVVWWPTLLLLVILPSGAALKCYQCGLADITSCDAFEIASTWKPFEVDCPPENICIKTTSPNGGTVRACGIDRTASGLIWPLNCSHGSSQLSSTQMCMCDTNLCNSGMKCSPVLYNVLIFCTVSFVLGLRYVV